jgi:replication protein
MIEEKNQFSDKIDELKSLEKRNFKQSKKLINLHDEKAALSNRRLTHQNLRFSDFSLEWSIDRITLVGLLNALFVQDAIYNEKGKMIHDAGTVLTMGDAMPFFEKKGIAEATSNGWTLLDEYGENVAYVEVLKFKDKKTGLEKGRIDFNPNKIRDFIKSDLKDFIKMMFYKPHFSRADVACDVINLDDEYVSNYRIAQAVSFRPFYGQSGALETAYWGARSSERQVRLYNKKIERLKKGEIVPSKIKSWWRLELQLRRSKASEWVNVVDESLDNFYNPKFIDLDLSAVDKIMLDGLHADHQNWSKLSDNSRRKYRKLSKLISKEDELTQHLKESFSESVEDLDKQLNGWLIGMNVVFEKEYNEKN